MRCGDGSLEVSCSQPLTLKATRGEQRLKHCQIRRIEMAPKLLYQLSLVQITLTYVAHRSTLHCKTAYVRTYTTMSLFTSSRDLHFSRLSSGAGGATRPAFSRPAGAGLFGVLGPGPRPPRPLKKFLNFFDFFVYPESGRSVPVLLVLVSFERCPLNA